MVILDQDDGGLLAITQPRHAEMAAVLAQAWIRPLSVPEEVWPLVIEAVTHHDDGWAPVEQQPPVDGEGRPYGFDDIPTQIHTSIWRASVENESLSLYSRLLIALHARSLYTHYSREHDDAERQQAMAFIDELSLRVADWIAEIKKGDGALVGAMHPTALDAAAKVLSCCDGLSLIMLGAVPPRSQLGPAAFGKQHTTLRLSRTKRAVTLFPWPFRPPSVEASVEAVKLTRAQFESDQALAEAMKQGERVELSRRLQPE